MEIFIIFIVLLIVALVFKKVDNVIIFFGLIDIFLRILAFIKRNIPAKDIAAVIGKYLPESVIDIINKYTANMDTVNIILKWCFVGIMCVFLFYCTKILIKNKRI